MEFKGQEGLQLLLAKGLDFGLWDQQFADSRCGAPAARRRSLRRSRAPSQLARRPARPHSSWPPSPAHPLPPPTRALATRRRFTGDPVTAEPDVTELALKEGDEFLVVASDGLWDVMDSAEVVKLARRELGRGASPQVCPGWLGWAGQGWEGHAAGAPAPGWVAG